MKTGVPDAEANDGFKPGAHRIEPLVPTPESRLRICISCRLLHVECSLLAFGALVLTWLSIGLRMGKNLYRYVASWEAFKLGYSLSEISLLALVDIWGVTAVGLLFKRRVSSLSLLVLGGAGAILAYACNKVLKELFKDPRPHNIHEYAVASCPPLENWSDPSLKVGYSGHQSLSHQRLNTKTGDHTGLEYEPYIAVIIESEPGRLFTKL